MKPIEILLVEDNPGDVDLAREALAAGKVCNFLHVVGDGEAALAFLRRQGKFAGALRPDLVLLDLNLPKLNGRDVLAAIKEDPDLRRIPVVILTTSKAEEDIDELPPFSEDMFTILDRVHHQPEPLALPA